MYRLDLLVGEVGNVGRRELGFNGDLDSLEVLVLVGEGLVESVSPGSGLTESLVVTELGFVFFNRGLLSSGVNPLDADGDLGKQLVAFFGVHVISEVTSLRKFTLQLVGVALKLVSGTFPVKELVIGRVEGQFLLTEGFLLLGRDSVRGGIELNSSVGSASSLLGLVLLLLSGTVLVHGGTDGHLLHFGPALGKLSAL